MVIHLSASHGPPTDYSLIGVADTSQASAPSGLVVISILDGSMESMCQPSAKHA